MLNYTIMSKFSKYVSKIFRRVLVASMVITIISIIIYAIGYTYTDEYKSNKLVGKVIEIENGLGELDVKASMKILSANEMSITIYVSPEDKTKVFSDPFGENSLWISLFDKDEFVIEKFELSGFHMGVSKDGECLQLWNKSNAPLGRRIYDSLPRAEKLVITASKGFKLSEK